MTTPRLILILILALSIFSPISFSISGANAQDIDSPSDETLTSNPVYQKQCAKCHGKSAEGRHFGGPSLVSPKIAAASIDDLRNVINNGKGRMPKYSGKLSSEEINRLIVQIKGVNSKQNR